MKMKQINREIPEKILARIVGKIKKKKELANLDDRLCAEKIKKITAKFPKIRKKLENAENFEKIRKSAEIKQLVKLARAEIRPVYGLFQAGNAEKTEKLLKKLEEEIRKQGNPLLTERKILEIHNEILQNHVSTRERLKFYSEFFEKIFQIIGKPQSIIDLGCGFNPMALPYMDRCINLSDDFEYSAVEMNQNDLEIIKKYFGIIKSIERYKNAKIDGLKLNFEEETEKIPKKYYGACLAFKIFDLISTKAVERIVNSVNCRWLVASFPTKTITTRNMRFKRRAGFQKMLRRLGRKYETVEFDNELVYVIRLKD